MIDILSRLLRPGPIAEAVAAALSFPLRMSGIRKDVVDRNLEIALPDVPAAERARIAKRTYDHMIWVGIETIVLQRDPKQVVNWVESETADRLRTLAETGAIFLCGHVGNWELTAAWAAQLGYKITAIVRESDDPNERGLVEEMRARLGVACMPKNAPMTRVLGILKRREFLGILPDQHGGPEGIMAPFFGRETATSQGAAVFGYLTKKPLVPVFSHRISPFRHSIRIGDPIQWSPGPTRDATILDIATKINQAMEQCIREAPDQWLAAHRRFREYY